MTTRKARTKAKTKATGTATATAAAAKAPWAIVRRALSRRRRRRRFCGAGLSGDEGKALNGDLCAASDTLLGGQEDDGDCVELMHGCRSLGLGIATPPSPAGG